MNHKGHKGHKEAGNTSIGCIQTPSFVIFVPFVVKTIFWRTKQLYSWFNYASFDNLRISHSTHNAPHTNAKMACIQCF